MNDPIIHIGMPRTGTSWFQTNFFPFVSNIYFAKRKIIQDTLIHPSSLSFNEKKLRQLVSKKKRLVISEEMITGRARAGSVNHVFFKEYLQRLQLAFPGATYVIILRNPLTAIQSMYNLYIKKGGTYRLKQFLSEDSRLQQMYLFSKSYYHYNTLLNYLMERVGNKNILVLLYEDFQASPQNFLTALRDNLSLEVDLGSIELGRQNESFSSSKTGMKRFLNHFTRHGVPYKHYYFHLPGVYNLFKESKSNSSYKRRKLPVEIRNLATLYAESNLKTMKQFGLENMRLHGYPLPE